MTTSTNKSWETIGRLELEAAARPGRWLWVSDGTLGYARELDAGESVAAALDEFRAGYDDPDGDPVESHRVYQNGEEV